MNPWKIWNINFRRHESFDELKSSWFISRQNLFNSRIPFHSSRKLIILQSVIYPLASITMRFSWTFHVAWHLSKRIASASLFSECVVSINLRILKHFLFSFCRLLCRQILRQWQSDFWHLYYHLIKVSSSLSFFYFGWQRFSFPFKSECRATKWRFIAVTFFFNGNWYLAEVSSCSESAQLVQPKKVAKRQKWNKFINYTSLKIDWISSSHVSSCK